MPVIFDDAKPFGLSVPVVIVGGGACGLVAALAAKDAGAEVLVLERDDSPAGSTALSSGFIPASDTRFQRAFGLVDSPGQFAADILRKNHGEADSRMVEAICNASGPTIEWLADRHGIAFVLVEGFLYPGHSVLRMHAVPEQTGRALMAALLSACERAGVDILPSAHVLSVFADRERRIRGVSFARPDGSVEEVGCEALVLASSGFGGNRDLVHRFIPQIADAEYFGHAGNQGDAIAWGTALGGRIADMGAYQGHGSVATPHGVLITWALMMEGGIQVNARGERFSNEHEGYSEQCVSVLSQPGQVACDIYDERLHRLGLGFDDYRQANESGAVKSAPDLDSLAARAGLPAEGLKRTMELVAEFARGRASDPFGRDFSDKTPLAAPFYAIKVTGALFHTQGGLVVDDQARVLGADGKPLPNLLAGGGAARGVSGAHVWGYLSGNGLLAATTLGHIAGKTAVSVIGKRIP